MGANAITDEQFKSEVLEATGPVLVDFWAEWCGPCKKVGPIVDEIADENGDVIKVVKLNIDENPFTPRQYGVMSIPTLLVFENGEPTKRVVGAKPKQILLMELGVS